MGTKELITRSRRVRKLLLDMTYHTGNTGAHIGGALSLVEIMVSLYYVMNYDINNMKSASRDRLILSKGHGVMTQYAVLSAIGVIPEEELATFKMDNTRLYAHPSMNEDMGIEFASGSLGQGLSLGVGTSLALKKKNNPAKVYVVIGDGECDEGQIWEAAATASHYKLDNLCVVIDCNKLQYDGKTEEVIDKSLLEERWKSFGFITESVDGHNTDEIVKSLESFYEKKPKVLIANTKKGKGVSFMENNPDWHNRSLTNTLYQQALDEMRT